MATQSYQLVMRAGPTPGKTFVLTKNEIFIGRDLSNDIVINDAEVSRKHVRLEFQVGQYVLEDLGSTNGTFVRGERISGPFILTPGDIFQLGDHVTMAYEFTQIDPDATVAKSSEELRPQREEPVPVQAAALPRSYQPSPLPPYPVQAAPPPPVSSQLASSWRSNRRTWILGGCGCLTLLFLCTVVPLFVIDYLNLWCTIAPFIPNCP